jgi:cyclic pyranopterin phosphate synthase
MQSTNLIDNFGRKINYIRLSITEHCNYRCFYCRDENHKVGSVKEDILSYEEIHRIVQIFASLGVSKIRLTGGEPLLRRGIVKIASLINSVDGITDIPLSTNAHLLEKFAEKLYKNSVKRVNVSLDSLNAKNFLDITRDGDLIKVLKGIKKAQSVGMSVKINVVIMQGRNTNEIENMLDFARDNNIEMRFIETMPIGISGVEALKSIYSKEQILIRAKKYLGALQEVKGQKTAGPAKIYENISEKGITKFGIISAVSENFCENCNRLRITAKGDLILCLGQENKVELMKLMRDGKSDKEIKAIVINTLKLKPKRHNFEDLTNIDNRQMVEIGG